MLKDIISELENETRSGDPKQARDAARLLVIAQAIDAVSPQAATGSAPASTPIVDPLNPPVSNPQ